MGWRTPPIEWVRPVLLRRYRNLREIEVDRSRLGLSEREVQASLHPEPRRTLVFAGVLSKRGRAEQTADPTTGR